MIKRVQIDANANEDDRERAIGQTRAELAYALLQKSDIGATDNVSVVINVRKKRNRNNAPIDIYFVSGYIIA